MHPNTSIDRDLEAWCAARAAADVLAAGSERAIDPARARMVARRNLELALELLEAMR